ncbi:MAG: hypothetical protein ACT7A5_28620 [Ferrovibrionaceae bacterium]
MWWRSLILLAALALTAACQPLPQPFQPDNKGLTSATDPLLQPGPSFSLLVTPVRGLGTNGQKMADDVAQALQDREIPASSHSASKASYVLTGEAREAAGGGSQIVWTVVDPRGVTFRTLTQPIGAPAASLAEAKVSLSSLAVAAAALIEPALQEDASLQRGPPKVRVAAVTGAPGDGDQTLPSALGAVLEHRKVAQLAPNAADAYVVAGKVRMTDGPRNGQTIEIQWIVTDAAGKEIGTVGQKNVVPKGSLDGKWGDIAFAAAEGAAEGLSRILEALGPVRPTR